MQHVLGISTFCPWIEVNVLHPRTYDLGLTAMLSIKVHSPSRKVKKYTGFRTRTHYFGCSLLLPVSAGQWGASKHAARAQATLQPRGSLSASWLRPAGGNTLATSTDKSSFPCGRDWDSLPASRAVPVANQTTRYMTSPARVGVAGET